MAYGAFPTSSPAACASPAAGTVPAASCCSRRCCAATISRPTRCPPSPRPAESEDDLASMIAMDEADCGLGIRAAAAGLDFVPLHWEEFDLVMRRRDYFEPPVQALLAFARTETFARRASFLGGYDLTGLGEVRYNA
jgi:putative molybdopterin biosynthesis protein